MYVRDALTVHSILQRINLVSAFALSVVSVLSFVVALSGLQIGAPTSEIRLKKADVYVTAANDKRLWTCAIPCRSSPAALFGDAS